MFVQTHKAISASNATYTHILLH